jgi:hypothetical protein
MASLNGTTPATTFPSLIKFNDNSAISSTKRLLSDGDGGATPLYLSSTQLNIGGTGLINATLGAKGIGTTSATQSFKAENSTATTSFILGDDGTITTNQPSGGSNYTYVSFQRGGTNWLRFGGVSGAEGIFKIGSLYLDASDNVVVRGTNLVADTSPVTLMNASTTGSNGAVGSSRSHFACANNGTVAHSYGSSPVEGSILKIASNISIVGGTNNSFLNIFESRPTINQTSGTVNIIGYTYNPTLTSILGAHYGVLIKPTNTLNGIGLGATMPTATLHLKGSGTTTSTKSLQIENNNSTKQVLFDDAGNLMTNGSMAIGQTTPANSTSILELVSTSQGFLPPRMTTTQINAISSPANGLIVYNTTIDHMCVYQGGSWVKINHSPM